MTRLTQMYGPAVRCKRLWSTLADAVLRQFIRSLIGACAPGHHGYQRACDLDVTLSAATRACYSKAKTGLDTQAQFLSTGFREFPELVVFLTARLHALPQLIECSVGLCIGCDDPAHYFLGAFHYPARRYQSHALNRRVKIADNLWSLGLVTPCFR